MNDNDPVKYKHSTVDLGLYDAINGIFYPTEEWYKRVR